MGLHSFWGMIGMIMKETHMTWDEILYKRSWVNVRAVLADIPRLTRHKKREQDEGQKKVIPINGSDLAKQLGL